MISLGYEAFVVPADIGDSSNTSWSSFCGTNSSQQQQSSCVALHEGGVRTEAFALLSSTGSTPVLPPANPSAVSAVLVAPQVLHSFHRRHTFLSLQLGRSNVFPPMCHGTFEGTCIGPGSLASSFRRWGEEPAAFSGSVCTAAFS